MVSFFVRNLPNVARHGDIIKDFYLGVDNDTSEDIAVTWYVYDAGAGYKLLGSDSYTAYANRSTVHKTSISFTMPQRDLNLYIKYIAVGKKTNRKYENGFNITIKERPPFDKIQAAIVSYLKKRPICHEVKENVFLIEVTDTVQQARDGVQSAWLVIDVDINIQKMKVEKGWPSNFCTTPNCIVQRWLNGQEVQRTTIDGTYRYLVTMPCSILILYYNGRKEHAGSVMSQNDMLTWLTWYGYIGQIVEDTGETEKKVTDTGETEKKVTDTGETEKKDNIFLMLAAGGAALLLIGILLRRR